jgi:hypothetical protein
MILQEFRGAFDAPSFLRLLLAKRWRFDIVGDSVVVQKKRGREDGKRLNTDLRGLTAVHQLALRGVGKRFDSPFTTKLVHNPAFSRDLLPAVGVVLMRPVVSVFFNQNIMWWLFRQPRG